MGGSGFKRCLVPVLGPPKSAAAVDCGSVLADACGPGFSAMAMRASYNG